MILDANCTLSLNQALTVTAASTGVYDTAGLGVGNPVQNIFGVTATSFGEDLGGGGPNASGPQLGVLIGTTFTAGGAATLQTALQAATDTTNTGTPGTWYNIVETDTIAVALLTSGRFVAKFSVPERYLGQNFPRFYRLYYTIASGPMLTGTIAYAGLLTGIDSAVTQMYPANY